MRTLPTLVALCCLALTFASNVNGDKTYQCNLLQRLKLKDQWAEVYSNGLGRLGFGTRVIEKFVLTQESHRILLQSVDADLHSVRFYAYLARKFGAINMFIGQLEEQATFQALIDHAKEAYAPLNRDKDFYDDFIQAVISAAVKDIIKHYDHFDFQSWQSCLTVIFSGIITKENSSANKTDAEAVVTSGNVVDDHVHVIEVVHIDDEHVTEHVTERVTERVTANSEASTHSNVEELTTVSYVDDVVNDQGKLDHTNESHADNDTNDDTDGDTVKDLEHIHEGDGDNVVHEDIDNDDGDDDEKKEIQEDHVDNVAHDEVIHNANVDERTTDVIDDEYYNIDDESYNADEDNKNDVDKDTADDVKEDEGEEDHSEDGDVEDSNEADDQVVNVVNDAVEGDTTAISTGDHDEEHHEEEHHEEQNVDKDDHANDTTTAAYNNNVDNSSGDAAQTVPTIELATTANTEEPEVAEVEKEDVDNVGPPKELFLNKTPLPENEANKEIAQLEIMFNESNQ